jgi:hypothetical protein
MRCREQGTGYRAGRLTGTLTVIWWGLVAAVAWGQAPVLAPYEPEQGCYVGAYVELDHNVEGDIETFEKMAGRKHASYFKYVGYGQPFPYKWVRELHARDAIPHIAWEPNEGLEPVRDDDYLRGWAQAAARTEGPVFLRYASEMNGNWMAYSGDPDLYIEKWRLVYRIMHEAAPNVVMIWCPYALPRATIPVYYPGDEYVDWVGVNIYSVAHADGDPSKPPSEDPRDLLRYVYDMFAARKPIAVCEYAATHYCVAKQAATVEFALTNMTRMYSSLRSQFPRVKMINWFSVDTLRNNLARNNYSLTDNAQVLATYQKLTGGDYFLSRPVMPGRLAQSGPSETGEGSVTVGTATSPGRTDPPVVMAPAGKVGVVVQGSPPEAVRGRVEIVADMGSGLEAEAVTFFVNGRFVAVTNVAPFRFTWNTERYEPGEYTLKIVATNYAERPIATGEATVLIATGEQ